MANQDGSDIPAGLDDFLATPAQGTAVPPIANGQAPSAVPAGLDDFVGPEMKQAKYGTLEQQTKAGLEGAASAMTFGASTLAERLAGVKKEDINARAETTAHTAGEVLGVGASALIPGLGEFRAANALEHAGAAGAEALGLGAADLVGAGVGKQIVAHAAEAGFQGVLYQSGTELSKMFAEDPKQTAESAISDLGLAFVLTGAFGGATGAAEEAFKKAAVEAAPFLKNFQEERAAKALGFSKGQVSKLKGGQNEAKDIARTLMDAEIDSGEKIFTPLVGAEELGTRVEKLRVSSGERMGNVYEALDSKNAPGISPLDLASKIDEKLGTFWRSPINKGESTQLENILESVLLRGEKDMSFRESQLLKEEVRKVAFPNGKNPIEPSPRIQIAQDAYRIISGEIDTAVDRSAKEIGDPGLLKELTQAKKEYAAAKKAGKAIADRVSSEQGNKMFGLTDTIAGTVAGAAGGFGPAAAALMLKKLAEKYGNTAIASSADTYAQNLGKFASAFGVGDQAKNAQVLAKATVDGYRSMQKAAKGVFSTEAAIPSNIVSLADHREKLSKIVEESIKNPDRLYGINDNNPVEAYKQPFAETSARAVAYLSNLRPNTDPSSPLGGKKMASAEATAKYNRALSIAQEPMLVVHSIKSGMVTSQDVATFQTLYPSLYNQISQQLTTNMIAQVNKGEIIPYKTRIGLSLFLGHPLDSSLSAASIIAAQPKPVDNSQSPGQGGPGTPNKPPSASSMKPLSKMSSAYRTAGQAAEMTGKENQK